MIESHFSQNGPLKLAIRGGRDTPLGPKIIISRIIEGGAAHNYGNRERKERGGEKARKKEGKRGRNGRREEGRERERVFTYMHIIYI